MTNFKQCNCCETNCRHKGAIRLCVCGKYTAPKMTNGDIIRAMTDEDLSVFLRKVMCKGAALEACEEFWEDNSYSVDWLQEVTT